MHHYIWAGLIFVWGNCLYSIGMACPGFFSASELGINFQSKRKEVLVFRFDKIKNSIDEIPIQIDPRTILGRHKFLPKKSMQNSYVLRNDRIFFHSSFFGNRMDSLQFDKIKKKYCPFKKLIEIYSPSNNSFGYMGLCPGKVKKEYASVVHLDLKKAVVNSANYNYKFNPTNHMLFEKVTLLPEKEAIASNSRLIIGNDVINFFNIVFDSDDIVSKLEQSSRREIGTAARVSFYLKILFLKIELALKTDLSFYQDSAHIPMVAHLPIHAPDYLNPGSGILYLWEATDDPTGVNMPSISDNQKLNQQKFCQGNLCYFKIVYKRGKREFSLNFSIKRNLIDLGFHPKWVSKKADLKKLKWLDEQEVKPKESGVYFETSKLPKGSHKWNFWLKIGSTLTESCPEKMEYRELTM